MAACVSRKLVELRLFWQGSREFQGKEVSVIDIVIRKLPYKITASLPIEIDPIRFHQLMITTRENQTGTCEKESPSIQLSSGLAKTLSISARLIITDPQGKPRQIDLKAPIKKMPEFQDEQTYGLFIQSMDESISARVEQLTHLQLAEAYIFEGEFEKAEQELDQLPDGTEGKTDLFELLEKKVDSNCVVS